MTLVESRKWYNSEPISNAGLETQKNRHWYREGEREGGTNWESGTDIYTTMCEIFN